MSKSITFYGNTVVTEFANSSVQYPYQTAKVLKQTKYELLPTPRVRSVKTREVTGSSNDGIKSVPNNSEDIYIIEPSYQTVPARNDS